ncbi:DUF1127 domain-containing protein [Rhodobacterales bacterium HKCCE3408]|nr:DUF1127 domain-containing protein [Rhodobacterales bacterium HKCCE3408]
MAYVSSSRNHSNGLVARLRGFASAAREQFAAYSVYRRTEAELRGLSDRELADLGISRSMISSIAAQAAFGEDTTSK